MAKAALRWKQIETFTETHKFIMNADVCRICPVSAATENRILVGPMEKKLLTRCRRAGHFAYKAADR